MSFAEAFTQTFPGPDWWRALDGSQRALSVALAFSLVAHASVLAVHFSVPEQFRMQSREMQLDVILVNAKHASKPVKAEALAQANLDGGGDAAKGRAQSFLTASKQSQDGDRLQQVATRMQQLEAEQKKLLSKVTDSPNKIAAAIAKPQDQPTPAPPIPQMTGTELRDNSIAILRQEAEIAKRIADENARPKRGYVTPSTREVAYAMYYKQWADKVERIGNNNYPDAARGRNYRMTLTVSVLADGKVEKIEVEKSSGSRDIDNAARRIVKMGEPYGRFSPQMMAEYGVLDLTMTWTFSRTEALSVETPR